MRVAGVSLLLLSACGFEARLGPDDNELEPPADCNAWPQMPSHVDPCEAPAPTTELVHCTTGPLVLSTTDGMLLGGTQPTTMLDTSHDPDLLIVVVDRLEVCAGATLNIIGPHPAVFVVHGEVKIDGVIDASAWVDPQGEWRPGPGGDLCATGNGASGRASTDGAGGGGGGGHGEVGGAGGPGDPVGAVDGGLANGSVSPLRGGCRGGDGGDGQSATPVALGGPGGGAVQIAARDGIAITGEVRAAGGPGRGGPGPDDGGGGGGSGGTILLEAATITVAGAACANGGGGGGGANDGGPLDPGGDGAIGTCDLSAAAGGPGGTDSGRPGGKGGSRGSAAEAGLGADEGGGGGGGAVGRIGVHAASAPALTGVVTPAPR